MTSQVTSICICKPVHDAGARSRQCSVDRVALCDVVSGVRCPVPLRTCSVPSQRLARVLVPTISGCMPDCLKHQPQTETQSMPVRSLVVDSSSGRSLPDRHGRLDAASEDPLRRSECSKSPIPRQVASLGRWHSCQDTSVSVPDRLRLVCGLWQAIGSGCTAQRQ